MSYGYDNRRQQKPRSRRRPSGFKLRMLIALGIVAFSFISYWAKTDKNPITGENQRVSLSPQEEVALGLNAMPQMAAQHGGMHNDPDARRNVQIVGARLVNALDQELARKGGRNPYQFDFHLLADRKTINAFALPGGQVFITYALYAQLTEGQLAGVLGHEVGHVVKRHGAERMAKDGLFKGIAGAAGVFGGNMNSARMASMITNLTQKKYGRDDEYESDRWGVLLTTLAGYDPRGMLAVMDVLEKSAGAGGPEFMSTHPRPDNRKEFIESCIKEYFPNGLPPGLR